jgi:hypothetical protein
MNSKKIEFKETISVWGMYTNDNIIGKLDFGILPQLIGDNKELIKQIK